MPVDSVAPFRPAVSRWFRQTPGEPTPPQEMGWPVIRQGTGRRPRRPSEG